MDATTFQQACWIVAISFIGWCFGLTLLSFGQGYSPAVFSFRELDHLYDILNLVEALISFNVSFWLLSVVVGKSWPVDFIWSTWPFLQLCYLLWDSTISCTWGWNPMLHCSGTWGWQAALQVAVTFVWGSRLTLNFVDRGGVKHEKSRYADLRETFGPSYNVVSLLIIFAAHTTFMFVGCLPMLTIVRSTRISAAHSIGGALVCLAGIAIEHVADQQMNSFVQLNAWKREQQIETKTILDTGLWGWSRHPNYYGQLLFWWGTWYASIESIKQGDYSDHFHFPALFGDQINFRKFGVLVFAPCLISIYFHIVIADFMEGRMLEKRPKEYEEYMCKITSPILMWPPSCYEPSTEDSSKFGDQTKKEKRRKKE
jgi:steroid 5-alpha reductase family enzyme